MELVQPSLIMCTATEWVVSVKSCFLHIPSFCVGFYIPSRETSIAEPNRAGKDEKEREDKDLKNNFWKGCLVHYCNYAPFVLAHNYHASTVTVRQ